LQWPRLQLPPQPCKGTKEIIKNKKKQDSKKERYPNKKIYLREGGNRFLQDGDDAPHHDGDADDAGNAPQR
jgi:hypothetical protein